MKEDNTAATCSICDAVSSTIYDTSNKGIAGFGRYSDCYFQQRAVMLEGFQKFAIEKRQAYESKTSGSESPGAKRARG